MLTFLLPVILAQASAEPVTQTAPATPPPPPCEGEQYESFDFWVGEWDVYAAGRESKVAESRIEKLYNGCAVRENWMPLSSSGGGSLNSLDPDTGRWHQTWIGSSPGRVEFIGGPLEDGRMVLFGYWDDVGGPGVDALVRMTYTKLEDGSVRQFGESSNDHGLTWTASFDFTYRPKEGPAE